MKVRRILHEKTQRFRRGWCRGRKCAHAHLQENTGKMKARRILHEKAQRFLRGRWRCEEGLYINKEQRWGCDMLQNTIVSMGVAPQPCGNWREEATRVSRKTRARFTWQAQTKQSHKGGKSASFGLWKKTWFSHATRNYRQFCNRMCLLLTGTWRRRDLLVSRKVVQVIPQLISKSSPNFAA